MLRLNCRDALRGGIAFCLTPLPGALLAAPNTAAPADYPARTVTVVVPMGPGGPTDLLARIIGRHMNERLGQPVIVENRPGAAGGIGTAAVARSKPDGHTLLSVSDTIGLNPILYSKRKSSYDLMRDFAPVTDLISTPIGVYVRGDSPIQSLAQLVEMGKSKPELLNYGSPGAGTPPYIAMEVLKDKAGINILHLPYPGTTPMVQALLGGSIQVGASGISGVNELLKSKQLRLLLIMDHKRWPDFPDAPTISDLNLDVPEAVWFANQSLYAPAGTPRPVIDRVFELTREALSEPTVKSRWEDNGSRISTNGPDALTQRLNRDVQVWKDLLTRMNINLD